MPKLLTDHDREKHADILADYLPGGRIFESKKIQDQKLRKLLIGLSGVHKEAEEKINMTSEEYDIRTTTLFIEEWEEFVGIPDDCFDVAEDLPTRRANVLTKFTSLGVQTEEEFKALAATFGFTIEIKQGGDQAIFPLVFPTILFETEVDARNTFIVEFTEPSPTVFPLTFPIEFGESALAILECLFNKLKPATSAVIFRQV